jgi:X-X-X-Leu-X-X-Gly heptad repeat protein
MKKHNMLRDTWHVLLSAVMAFTLLVAVAPSAFGVTPNAVSATPDVVAAAPSAVAATPSALAAAPGNAVAVTPSAVAAALNIKSNMPPLSKSDLVSTEPAVVSDKEEIIYANLTYDGSVQDAYAINHFTLAQGGYFSDNGSFISVSNLTNTQALTRSGTGVAAAANAGDFYYQGNMGAAVLPWQIGLSYTFDGQTVAAKDASTLAGRSGHLELHLTTSQASSTDSSFYENYALQVALTIDAAKSANVEAPDATVTAAGSNRTVTYTVLPGSNGDLTFAADVVDFEMPGIQIAAVPFSMSFEAPDTSSLSDEMTQLVDAVRELNSGAAALNGGFGALADAAGQLSSGVADFGAGLDAASAGSSGLTNGSAQLSANLAQISGGLSALLQMGAFEYLRMGDPVAYAQLVALIDGLGDVSSGYTSLDDGIASYTDGVNTLAATYDSLEDGAALLSGGVQDTKTGMRKLATGTSALYGGIQDMPQTMQEKINEFTARYDFSDFVPHSFLSADNSQVSLVQFVLTTPAIEPPKAIAASAVPEPEQTFLDRFFALFS